MPEFSRSGLIINLDKAWKNVAPYAYQVLLVFGVLSILSLAVVSIIYYFRDQAE